MNRNVFRFRRLKWGDPEKFRMLPGETTPPGAGARVHRDTSRKARAGIWFDRMLIAAIILAVCVSAILLVG